MRWDILGAWTAVLLFCLLVWTVVGMVAIAIWAWLWRPWGEVLGAWPW